MGAGGAGPLNPSAHGSTVGEIVDDLCAGRPALAGRILGADGRQLVGIFVNGRSVRQLRGLQTPIGDGDEIRLTPPIAGG